MFERRRARRAERQAAFDAEARAHQARLRAAREAAEAEMREAAVARLKDIATESRNGRQRRLTAWMGRRQAGGVHEVPLLAHQAEDRRLAPKIFDPGFTAGGRHRLLMATTETHLVAISAGNWGDGMGPYRGLGITRVLVREKHPGGAPVWVESETYTAGVPDEPALFFLTTAGLQILQCSPDHPAADALWAAGLFANEPGRLSVWDPISGRSRNAACLEIYRDPPLRLQSTLLDPEWVPREEVFEPAARREAAAQKAAATRKAKATAMTPRLAEETAAKWMTKHGWPDAVVTQYSGDSGIDVWGPKSRSRPAAAAQVKYEQGRTGRPALQNLFGAGHGRSAGAWLFFSRGDYTQAARDWAMEVGMALFLIDHKGTITATNAPAGKLRPSRAASG